METQNADWRDFAFSTNKGCALRFGCGVVVCAIKSNNAFMISLATRPLRAGAWCDRTAFEHSFVRRNAAYWRKFNFKKRPHITMKCSRWRCFEDGQRCRRSSGGDKQMVIGLDIINCAWDRDDGAVGSPCAYGRLVFVSLIFRFVASIDGADGTQVY